MKVRLTYLLILLFFSLGVNAQDVIFKTICKKQVMVGEQFQVSYELNGDGKDFQKPDFKDFELIGGPFTSRSSSTNIVNGSVTRSNTQTFSFYLRAIKEGTFSLPQATITVNKTKIKSEPVEITVVSGGSGNSGSVSDRSQTSRSNSKDIILEAVPSKKSVFLGEQLVLTYKIYFTIPISQLSISKSPSYSGFWTKDISDNNGNLQQSSIMRNGQEYRVVTIQEVVLFPQKSGNLTIDPLDISCIAQIRQERQTRQSYDPFESFFDNIMGSTYTNVKKEITSQPIEIEVKPLPANKPATFNGSVGQYSFSSKIDKTKMKSNEAFTITYTVTGKGNIELLDMPKLVFPPDFEVYDPKITTSTKNNSFGISGTKKAEYVVIPRVSGDFTLEPVKFTYFDPAKEQYVTLSSDVYDLHVERSETNNSGGVIYAPGQEEIKILGSDIQHIKTNDLTLSSKNSYFFGSTLYFMTIVILIIIFTIAYISYKKINKFNKNEVLVRNKKANKIAGKRLKNAHQYLKENKQEAFYNELSQALWGYISDKLNISKAKLSTDSIKEEMIEKHIPEETVNQFIELIHNCEFALFAPGDPNKKMDELYQRGIEIITKVEKLLK